jgi:hypothetical protein
MDWEEIMANSKENSRSAGHHGAHHGGAGGLAVTPASQVAAFLTFFAQGNNGLAGVPNLMKLFSANDPTNPPFTSPIVGITNHSVPGQQIGPVFIGRPLIQNLFQQLFTCFNPLTFTAIDASPYMQSQNGSTIAVRLTLIGTQMGPWFSQGNPGGLGYSLPLSEIGPVAKGRATSTIAACAVFTFDSGNLINELALYMDRYKLMRDLQPANGTSFDAQITTFLRSL